MNRITIQEATVKYSMSKPTILKYVREENIGRKKQRKDVSGVGGKPYYLTIDEDRLAEVIAERQGSSFIA